MKFDTVPMETPAVRATSAMVGRLRCNCRVPIEAFQNGSSENAMPQRNHLPKKGRTFLSVRRLIRKRLDGGIALSKIEHFSNSWQKDCANEFPALYSIARA
jgi:hypothetical protein